MEPNFGNAKPSSPPPPKSLASSPKTINLRSQFEHMLHNSVLMTEMAMDLKERCVAGEKYVAYLRSVAVRGTKTMSALQGLTKSFLLVTQKLANSVITAIDNMPVADQACSNMKTEYEKLLTILEKELVDVEEDETAEHTYTYGNLNSISEKIKYLEAKQKKVADSSSYLPPTSSAKSFKSDVDEKYPDNWSRDSLIDLSTVVNLPSVPEDIFGYTSKPTRTSSLSSLKGMRKVKLYLQRAGSASDDDEDNSEIDDADLPTKFFVGDNDELRPPGAHLSPKKVFLGNIKEETQD